MTAPLLPHSAPLIAVATSASTLTPDVSELARPAAQGSAWPRPAPAPSPWSLRRTPRPAKKDLDADKNDTPADEAWRNQDTPLAQPSADLPADTLLAQATPEARSAAPSPTPTDAAATNSTAAAQANRLSTFFSKPMADHSASAAAAWFGAVPTGAVLSGAVMTLMALQSKDPPTVTPTPTPPPVVPDTQAPSLRSAEINNSTGNQLVLRYDERLLGTALPLASAFQVMVDGVRTTVSNVVRDTTDQTLLLLTLASPIISARAQVSVSLSDGSQVKDLAGNTAPTFRDQAVTVTDLVVPTLLSSKAISNATTSYVVLRFSEALKSTTVLDAANFQVSVAGVLQTITAQEVLGDSVRLTLGSKITSVSAPINLSYTPPSTASKAVQDSAGNLAALIGPVGGITVPQSLDSAAPTLVADNTAAVAIERQVRVVRLKFNEELDPSQLPDATAFSISVATGGSSNTVAVSSLKLLGSEVELTLASTLSTDPQTGLQVIYTPPSSGNVLKDWAGNPVTSFVRDVTPVNAVPPVVVSSRFTTDRTLELTFNEDLAPLGALVDNWSLTANGGAVLKPTGFSVSGKTLSLTFASAVQSGQAISLAYTAPTADATPLNRALQDTLGNDSPSFTRSLDSAGPGLTSAVTSANGLQVILSYNEALLAPNSSGTPVVPAVAANAFVVLRSDGSRISVTSVNVSGNLVTLGLANNIQPADTVSVIYNAPSPNVGVGNAALQDSSGNDAAALGSGVTGQAVVNAAVFAGSAPIINSTTNALNQLVMKFNEVITGNLPAIEAFTVKSGAVTQTITGIARDAKDSTKLVLTLSGSIDDAGPLLLSYTPPSNNPLTGASGKTLGTITSQNFGELITSTNGADTLTGAANRVDYFLGSTGNDTLSGLGGADHFVWPDFGGTGPGGFTQTLKDFGFKKGSGALQGSLEADTLNLSQLLNGYVQADEAKFLRAIKNADNKLVLQIDHDGGATFEPTANLLFDNVTFTTNDQLQVNSQFIAHTVNAITNNLTLATFVEHLRLEGQLTVL